MMNKRHVCTIVQSYSTVKIVLLQGDQSQITNFKWSKAAVARALKMNERAPTMTSS